MTKKERLNNIRFMLKGGKTLSIKDLSELYEVSEMTIRRDISELQRTLSLSINHGLVTQNDDITVSAYDYYHEKKLNIDKKEKIAEEAVKYIEQGMTIIFDIGTSVDFLVDELSPKLNIMAMCFSIFTVNKLINKKIDKIYLLGGSFQKDTGMFHSLDSVTTLKNKRADIYFMSAASISPNLELMCENEYEVLTKKAAIESSQRVVLLIDSTKFGKISPSLFSSCQDIDLLITDSEVEKKYLDLFKKEKINYLIVD